MKLLIIEDEKELATSIMAYLRQEDYICESAVPESACFFQEPDNSINDP